MQLNYRRSGITKCSHGFLNLDIFGEGVQFTFKKNTRFKTYIGASISTLMILFFIIFLSLRTIKLVNYDDPLLSMIAMSQAADIVIDLWQLDYMFAIENIDPRVGTIKAQQVSWVFTPEEDTRVRTEIELVNCNEYLKGGRLADYDLKAKRFIIDGMNMNRRRDATFLCPYVPEGLKVRGHFSTERFDYVKINIVGCDPAVHDCLPEEEVNGTTVNYVSQIAHPSLLDNDIENVVQYNLDYSYFKIIEPEVTQSTNIFF